MTKRRRKRADVEESVVKVRAVATVRHQSTRVVAGRILDADDPIVARCPGCFEPVDDAGSGGD